MALVEASEFLSRSGKKILIRNAQVSDSDDILNFIQTVAMDAPFLGRTHQEFCQITSEEHRKKIRDFEKKDHSFFLAAFEGDKVVATCDFLNYPQAKKKHRGFFGIAVLKEYRGERIGTKLMETMISTASRIPHLRFIELEVIDENTSAIQIYQKLGFEILHSTPEAVHQPDGKFLGDILMRLDLKK